MTGESPLRAAGRRAPAPAHPARCSCELLLSLCEGAAVQDSLAGFAVDLAALRRGVAELHAETDSEPADWRVRIAQRSAGRKGAGELDLLLAIVRSADCHAYQLLERAGVACGALRKRLIDQLREAENVAAHQTTPRTLPARPTRQSQPEARVVPLVEPRRARAEEPEPRRLRASESTTNLRSEPEPRRPRAAEPRDPEPRRLRNDAEPRRLRDSDTSEPRRLRDDTTGEPRRLRDVSEPRRLRDSDTSEPRRLRDDATGEPRRLRNDDEPRLYAESGAAPGRAPEPRRLHAADSGAAPIPEPRRLRADDSGVAAIDPIARRRAPAPVPEDSSTRRLMHRREPVVDPRVEADEYARDEPEPAPAPVPSNSRPELRPGPRLTAIDARTLAPLHGREAVLARLADAVLRRSPRPPLLVGPLGCGRSLVASHLARILSVPVFVLSAASHGDEDSLRADLAAVAKQRGVAILDDLDQVGSDAPPIFLPALVKIWSSGQPPILTIVSPEGRARLESWLPGLASTFDVLELPVLEGEALRAAVTAAAPAVLAQHGLSLGTGARLPELTRVAERFLGGLAMPGRALDLLDLACARTAREGRSQVHRDTWIDIVCERSGIPRERVEGLGNQEMLDLEGELGRTVVGHEHAIKALAGLIRRNRAGFSSQRPVATVLLLGPSGVGKTEIAKALSGALFDRHDALVRLDMSEYAESHAVARVIGAPPGYVGHEQGGALTDPLLRQPHCVVLLDEIEKAHRDVHQLLLQVLDEGRLTDGRGRTVDFRHAVLIMTSNLGADCLTGDGDDSRERDQHALEAARAAFPVELWNRIEAPLVLHPLTPSELATICSRLVRASSERLFRERGIRFKLSDRACRHVVGLCGRDAALGARPLRHVLTRVVEGRIADAILRGQVRAGMVVEVDVEDEILVLATSRAP